MSFDERALETLIEESQDLQVDAMRDTSVAIEEMVELSHERRATGAAAPDQAARFTTERRGLLRKGLLGAGFLATTGGFGSTLLSLLARPAWAQGDEDVQILQTAASLENLAVATYGVALTLPFIGGSSANPVVKKFAMTTMGQHREHGQAFNAAVRQLGGREQTNPNPVLLKVVEENKPSLTSPAAVVDLALALENTATQDYVAGVAALRDANAKRTMASIMGVESQHAATLSAVKALLAGGARQLIALPPNAAALPAAAGSVGFPDTFIPTQLKRPNDEGAVK